MTEKTPRVSVGLPVYNGERFLREALDAILAQTFTDFELIICDNASTDSTPDICREYMAKDARIRYHRQPINLGVSRNFNTAFELSRGEYFKWCAHDDVPHPTYIEKAVAVLDSDPSVVLCYARAQGIDEEGMAVRSYVYTLRTDAERPSERFDDLLRYYHPCFQTFGVIRASALRQTPLHEHYSTSDRIFLANLALVGRFYRLPEYLHFDREYPGTSVSRYRNVYRIMAMFDPSKEGKVTFPYWANLRGYLRAALRYRMPLRERLRCLYMVGWWGVRHRGKLMQDIEHAIKILLRPLYYRLRPRRNP